MGQTSEMLHNVTGEENLHSLTRDKIVLSKFPHVDFVCFQEVFDRSLGLSLVARLRSKYSHFVLDVGNHSIHNNFCLLSSGLMVASRFPLLQAKFVPFKEKRGFQWTISYGVLLCKVDLGERRVGILANLHAVAFQGKEQLIKEALTLVEESITRFRTEVVKSEEKLMWEVVAGDFNCDNLSPGDRQCAEHQFFQVVQRPRDGVARAGHGLGCGDGDEAWSPPHSRDGGPRHFRRYSHRQRQEASLRPRRRFGGTELRHDDHGATAQ